MNQYESSVPESQPATSEIATSKEVGNDLEDDLRPEYDLDQLIPAGERGKYAQRCRKEGIHVTITGPIELDDDVRKAFPTNDAINKALRRLIKQGAGQPMADDE